MFGFNKKSAAESTTAMTTGDRFHCHAKKALHDTAIAYGGKCVAAAGYGCIVGGAGDKTATKLGQGTVMVGGAMALAGSVGALYHGYKATAAAIDYTADKMNELYKDL